MGFPGGSDGRESACDVGDPGSIPESRRSPGEGNSYPFQYSYLENSMDRRVWWAQSTGSQRVRRDWETNTGDFSQFIVLTKPLLRQAKPGKHAYQGPSQQTRTYGHPAPNTLYKWEVEPSSLRLRLRPQAQQSREHKGSPPVQGLHLPSPTPGAADSPWHLLPWGHRIVHIASASPGELPKGLPTAAASRNCLWLGLCCGERGLWPCLVEGIPLQLNCRRPGGKEGEQGNWEPGKLLLTFPFHLGKANFKLALGHKRN